MSEEPLCVDDVKEEDCENECEKSEKEPRWMAIYKTSDDVVSYCKAVSGQSLKKLLVDVPVGNVLEIWRGKPRSIKTRAVISF